jgi:hypothetical protein
MNMHYRRRLLAVVIGALALGFAPAPPPRTGVAEAVVNSFGSGASGGTDPGLLSCQSQCDFLQTRSCISASEQSTCRTDCTTAGAKRDTFVACAQGASECPAAHDCYNVFNQ